MNHELDPKPSLITDPILAIRKRSRVRRRFRRLALIFVITQIIGSIMVVIRAKVVNKRLAALKPDDYVWREFPEIELERGDDFIQLYMHGPELVRDIVRSIDGATASVYVQTFIWVDDATGATLRDALARAASRGVKVHVMYDWLLSSRLPDGYFPEPIQWFAFKPLDLSLNALKPGNALRDHRKVVVIDEAEAFVGGYNWGDEYVAWRDTHVRIRGRSVGDIENAFADFWNAHRPLFAPRVDNMPGRSWDPHVSVHRNDPTLGIFPIRGMYLEAIDRAEKNVWITNAYFVPDKSFRTSLIEAARRGVDVRILVPRRSNHALSDALFHGMVGDLLRGGVRMFAYDHFMVHAKTCTIDGQWSTVGTANLDRWSMLGNYEINLELRSKAFAEQMEQMFELDLESCWEVNIDVWDRRPTRMKVAEQTLRALAPLM